MSGGRFEYNQYKIGHIAEEIKEELEKQGQEKHSSEIWTDIEKYPEEAFYETHPEDIQDIFKDAIYYLQLAQVYAQRIDRYLSGDDGEESLRKRLKEELYEIKRT